MDLGQIASTLADWIDVESVTGNEGDYGDALGRALERHGFPKEAIRFTRRTLSFLDAPLHVRAAVFFHGREDVIPRMFMPLVDRLDEEQVPCGLLKAYLERHIEADGDVHGPKAIELLDRLHAGDQQKISESLHSSVKALEARLQLWDSVHEVLQPGSAV